MTAIRAAAHRPRRSWQHGLVQREHIVGRLVATPDVVVLLVAPAGYGKTAVLTEWSEIDPRQFAWVEATPAHDDGVELTRAVTAALASVDEPLVLVIDNAHHLRSDEALTVLRRLIEKPSPPIQVAISSRRQLPLPLTRLRTERRLLELTAAELVLTRPEVADVALAAGLALDRSATDALAQRTEGWPAGVYLASLALRDEPSRRRALARFSGADRLVVDYVRDELLCGLDTKSRNFLLQSSILDRLSGPVCDAVLARKDSAQRLRELSRLNVLVVPLDRTDSHYRYHSLVAEALRAELRTTAPELERDLHGRASEWFEAQGDRELAIEHAIASGDIDRAGRLVWEEVPTLVGYGQAALLVRRLACFSREQIATSPSLLLAASAAHFARGDRPLAEYCAASADRLLSKRRGSASAVAAGRHALHAALACESADEMCTEAARARSAAPADSAWRTLACLLEGTSLRLSGDIEAARTRLEEGSRRGAVAAPALQVLCLAQQALIALHADELDAAETMAALARTQVDRIGAADNPLVALVFAASAAVSAHAGRPEASHRDARHADRLLARLADFSPWYTTDCRLALAAAALRSGELARARDLLVTAERELRSLKGADAAKATLAEYRRQSEQVSATAAGDAEPLTTAELRVLQFLPTHLSFPEIADQLFVSRNTIKTHVRAVYRKLAAASRSQAVEHARAAGLIDGREAPPV